jgi:tetratricopeptide (TPR) repeat protein
MKILGDLNFIDRGESAKPDNLASPRLSVDDAELLDALSDPLTDGPTDDEGVGDDHYAAAVGHYLRGEFEHALAELGRAQEAGGDEGEICTATAQIHLEQKDYDRAVDAYDRLLRIDDRNGAAHFNYGLALESVGRYENARTAFENAVQNSPELTEAYLGLGGCCLKLTDSKAAQDAYSKYLE